MLTLSIKTVLNNIFKLINMLIITNTFDCKLPKWINVLINYLKYLMKTYMLQYIMILKYSISGFNCNPIQPLMFINNDSNMLTLKIKNIM